MVLQVEAEIDRGLEPLLLEAPARQHGAQKLLPGDIRRPRQVAIGAPGHQDLEREALAIDAVRRPQRAAVHEGAEAPEIGAGEKEKMRDLLGASSHLGLRNASHTNTTKRREEPRGDARYPTHRGRPCRRPARYNAIAPAPASTTGDNLGGKIRLRPISSFTTCALSGQHGTGDRAGAPLSLAIFGVENLPANALYAEKICE